MLRDLLFRVRDAARPQTLLAVAVVLAVLAVVTTAVVLLTGGQSVPAGYTLTPTVAKLALNEPHAAQPRPAVAPPKIYAEGACKVALDGVRAVIDRYPSGLVLPTQGATDLNAALARLNAGNSPCTTTTMAAFDQQELTPWRNYLLPPKSAH